MKPPEWFGEIFYGGATIEVAGVMWCQGFNWHGADAPPGITVAVQCGDHVIRASYEGYCAEALSLKLSSHRDWLGHISGTLAEGSGGSIFIVPVQIRAVRWDGETFVSISHKVGAE